MCGIPRPGRRTLSFQSASFHLLHFVCSSPTSALSSALQPHSDWITALKVQFYPAVNRGLFQGQRSDGGPDSQLVVGLRNYILMEMLTCYHASMIPESAAAFGIPSSICMLAEDQTGSWWLWRWEWEWGVGGGAGAAAVIVGELKGRSMSGELIGRPPHVPIFILHIILAASRKWTGSHTMGRINHGTGQSDGAV